MNKAVRLPLQVGNDQAAALQALQRQFAQACNALAPRVAAQRCWNRVALHHLAYKDLREAFPQLGSQMACNAIHAVCKAARIVYQHPRSPFNVERVGAQALPRLQFTERSPVYFDRHTLTLRDTEVSLFTLDGRIRCPVSIPPATLKRLKEERLVEAALTGNDDGYLLTFSLTDPDRPTPARRPVDASAPTLPSHVEVIHTASPVDTLPGQAPRLNNAMSHG